MPGLGELSDLGRTLAWCLHLRTSKSEVLEGEALVRVLTSVPRFLCCAWPQVLRVGLQQGTMCKLHVQETSGLPGDSQKPEASAGSETPGLSEATGVRCQQNAQRLSCLRAFQVFGVWECGCATVKST